MNNQLIQLKKKVLYLTIVFYEFLNNFLKLLLCKTNVLNIFNTADFFQIFVASQNTEDLMNSNFRFGTVW